jgi:hypothetical protein
MNESSLLTAPRSIAPWPRAAGIFLATIRLGGEAIMSLGTILIIVLILMLVGVLPTWPHSREWGYAPTGIVGTIVIVLIVLFLLGRL